MRKKSDWPMMHKQAQVIIIGAGPAGLMAAITAAGQGKQVKVLECLHAPGRKLLASGAGKCNFTNMLPAASMAECFPPEQRRFVRPALLEFTPEQVRDFFARRGVNYKLTDDFYCFPVSEKADDILQVLLAEARLHNVEIICNKLVSDIKIVNNQIQGVYVQDEFYPCNYLIAAAGGPGFPRLGGRGSLDEIFARHGLTINKRTPALCGIKSSSSWLQNLAGIVLERVKLTLDKNNYSCGTLLFTGDGISAPAALDLAGRVAKQKITTKEVQLYLDFCPEKSREDWNDLLENARKNTGKRLIHNVLSDILPHAVAAALANASGAGSCEASVLSKTQRECLLNMLTACPISVSGVESWEKAMASTGGLSCSKLKSKTLQSRELNNLYAAGEFIDVDGPCGGYNIQWALSSGHLAGMLK